MNRKLIIDSSKPNTVKEKIACGTLFVTITYDTEGKIRFWLEPSKGGCAGNLEAIARLLTLLYNDKRIDNEKVIEYMKEVVCKACMRMKGALDAKLKQELGNSCADAIARILKELEIKEK